MKIELPVSLRINRPSEAVFDAFVNPEKINKFFCSDAKGTWAPNEDVVWRFGDEDIRVKVIEVSAPSRLKFKWTAHFVDYQTLVTIDFEPITATTTAVRLYESGWESDQEALKSALDHACGWENFLCSLKAWIEHGVDLRN